MRLFVCFVAILHAGLAIETAKRYRAEMDALPALDPARAIYEDAIRFWLEHSRRLSFAARLA